MFITPFCLCFFRIHEFGIKMEPIINDDNVIVEDNDTTTKRLYVSVGDTPEKPEKKSVGFLIRNMHPQAVLFFTVLVHHQR